MEIFPLYLKKLLEKSYCDSTETNLRCNATSNWKRHSHSVFKTRSIVRFNLMTTQRNSSRFTTLQQKKNTVVHSFCNEHWFQDHFQQKQSNFKKKQNSVTIAPILQIQAKSVSCNNDFAETASKNYKK